MKKRPDALQRMNRILACMRYQPLTELPVVNTSRIHVGLIRRLAIILGPEYRHRTLMLWVTQIMIAMAFYVVMSWTPKLAVQLGYAKQTAVLAGVLLSAGGAAGSIIMSLLSLKVRLSRLLTGYLMFAAVVIGLFGVFGQAKNALVIFPLLMGFALNGSIACMFSLAPTLYATDVRAMGMGWFQAVSQIGAVVGPVLVGVVIDTGWSVGAVFEVQTIPLVISMVAVISIYTGITRAAVGGLTQRAQ